MNIHGCLELARQASLKSKYKVKVGVVIVKGNRVLASGYNQIRYLSKGVLKYSAYKHSAHAERIACAKVAKSKLKGSTVFISRSFKDGTAALAAPCLDCFKLLLDMKVAKIVYSVADYPFYEVIKL
jgi:pyrimidine deaminase RibD-like protein